MLRTAAVVALAASLTACVVAPTQADIDNMRMRAARAPSIKICDTFANPNAPGWVRDIAGAELARRNENCSQYSGIIAARQQAEAARQANANAQIMAGAAFLAASRPQPVIVQQPMIAPPPPRTINCISTRNFNMVNTTCN